MTKIILDKVFAPISRPRRNIRCITYTATATLVAAMIAQGIPVKRHVLAPDQFVSPEASIGRDRLWELLHDSRFKFLGVVFFLVSSPGTPQNFTIPGNWNSTINGPGGFANKEEVVGGGGSGGAIFVSDPVGGTVVGGSGAAYSATTNLVFVPGSTAPYQIGVGGASITAIFDTAQSGHDGGDSWFNGSSLASASVSAERGHGGQSSTGTFTGGINGGQASNGIGTTKFSGGASGSATTSGDPVSVSGGGGAAGPNGNGNASANVSIGAGSAGGSADAGSGGGGGASGTAGGAGGNGTEYDASHGLGGGGGAGISQGLPTTTGGNGGLYGGGGGGQGNGSGVGGGTSGAGAQGLIVITNVPTTFSRLVSGVI